MTVPESKAKVKHIALGLIIGACLAQAGNMTYQDELDQQARYCANVEKSLWPDYKEIYQKECKKVVDN